MPRPIHFEIHAAEPERAIAFYSELLGWQFTKWEGPMPYWIVRTGDPGTPGIDGGLIQRMGGPPVLGQAVNAFVCTVDVEDLDRSVQRSLELGATIAVPKMPIPTVGWLAYVHDPAGNILGLMQMDPGAGASAG